jgi:hypothetical protein
MNHATSSITRASAMLGPRSNSQVQTPAANDWGAAGEVAAAMAAVDGTQANMQDIGTDDTLIRNAGP